MVTLSFDVREIAVAPYSKLQVTVAGGSLRTAQLYVTDPPKGTVMEGNGWAKPGWPTQINFRDKESQNVYYS